MEGKTYRINGSTVDETLNYITIDPDESSPDDILIQTSVRTRRLSSAEDAERFLKDAIEVPKENKLAKAEPVDNILLPASERDELVSIEQILMKQIEKIDKNERYVKQAREINITVKNLIGIKSMKLRAAEMILRANRKNRNNEENF